MKQKIINLISYGVLVLTFLVLTAYLYYSVYPFKVIEYDKTTPDGIGSFEILDKEVKKGEILRYRAVYTKYLNYSGEIFCYYEDGILFRIPPYQADNFVGYTNMVRAIQIPITLPAGEYRYSCQIFYNLPMGRELTYQFKTETFKVIE